jgi:hypothetical protein
MTSEGGAAYQAAVAYCRISSRRAELVGANAPISHAVTLMHEAAPPEQTSTQKIRAAIDSVLGVTFRERELEDKRLYSDEKLTVDEQAELDQLRAECEAKRWPSSAELEADMLGPEPNP